MVYSIKEGGKCITETFDMETDEIEEYLRPAWDEIISAFESDSGPVGAAQALLNIEDEKLQALALIQVIQHWQHALDRGNPMEAMMRQMGMSNQDNDDESGAEYNPYE